MLDELIVEPRKARRRPGEPTPEPLDNDLLLIAFALGEHGLTVAGVDRQAVLLFRHPPQSGLPDAPTRLERHYADWVDSLARHRERGARETIDCGCTARRMAWERLHQAATQGDSERRRTIHQAIEAVGLRFWANELYDAREAPLDPGQRYSTLPKTMDPNPPPIATG